MVKILSVAGFDGSGGAGVTSDAKIFSNVGVYGLSVITAMTAQSPDKVYMVSAVSEKLFEEQLKAIFDYFSVDGMKIGLLSNEKQSRILLKYIKRYGVKLVVVDPVYISTSDKMLISNKTEYPNLLFPLIKQSSCANITITPNIQEAELLSGIAIKDKSEMKKAAIYIKEKFVGIQNIIVKGSHLKSDLANSTIYNIVLNSKGDFHSFNSKRIKLKRPKALEMTEIHGTGCAFSGGLTAYMATGYGLNEALVKADRLVAGFIKNYKKISENGVKKNIYLTANI